MKNRGNFLGVGWKFPPSFEKNSGSVMLVSEEDDIKESLRILLSTKPGERVMNPKFGCDLSSYIFDSIDIALIVSLKRLISKAVLNFEPRITLDEVNVRADKQLDGIVNIELIYTIRKTNTRANMVYPYYIIEGNNVKYRPI